MDLKPHITIGDVIGAFAMVLIVFVIAGQYIVERIVEWWKGRK